VFDQQFIAAVTKIVPARCKIERLNGTTFNFDRVRVSAQDPTGEARSAPSDFLAEFGGLFMKRREGKGMWR